MSDTQERDNKYDVKNTNRGLYHEKINKNCGKTTKLNYVDMSEQK